MSIQYRAEIDGLRALAVISVIIYHLDLDHVLSHGYLGVDIFFVISGFLITSIILKERQVTGAFSFSQFYERRIRRLLPALAVVLLATVIASWFVLLPSQYVSLAKSGIASTFFFSNYYWYSISQDYEAASSLLQPLLHTWTLGVEEQFYLIFPIILVLIDRYIKKHSLIALSLFTLTSLALYLLLQSSYANLAFYALPTRLWEFSSGSILAYIATNHVKAQPKIVKRLIPVALAILLMVCISGVPIVEDLSYLQLILTVISTMGIMIYANKADLITNILSVKPLVFIGKISYSLYLWHYPVFALGRNLKHNSSYFEFSIWIAVTFILSIITYKFVEQPSRNRAKNFKNIFWALAILISCYLSISAIIISKEGFPTRFERLAKSFHGNPIENVTLKAEKSEFFLQKNDREAFETSKTNVLIIGDSHGKDLYLSFILNDSLYNKYSFYKTGSIYKEKTNSIDDKNISLYNHADIIIYCYRFSNKIKLINELTKAIRLMKKDNKRIIICGNNAEFKSYGRNEALDFYFKQNKNETAGIDLDSIHSFFYKNRRKEVLMINDSIKNFALKMNIAYLDRYSLVCDDSLRRCTGVTSFGQKTYVDGNHFSLQGAALFGGLLHNRQPFDSSKSDLNPAVLTNAQHIFESMISKKANRNQDFKELYKELAREINQQNISLEEKVRLKEKVRRMLKAERRVRKENSLLDPNNN